MSPDVVRLGRRALLLIGTLALLLVAGACRTPVAPDPDATVTFFTRITPLAEDNEVEIALGIRVDEGVPADDDWNAQFTLQTIDGVERGGGHVVPLSGQPGEQVLITWRGVLEPDTYLLTWGAPGYGGVARRFELVAQNDRLELGETVETHSETFPPTLD